MGARCCARRYGRVGLLAACVVLVLAVRMFAATGAAVAAPASTPAPAPVGHPILWVEASTEHPNVHQWLVSALDVESLHTYDVIQYGGTIAPYHWSCLTGYAYFVGRANCGARAVCSAQTPCDSTLPDMHDAIRFELVDHGTGAVVASIDMPDVLARVDRRADVVVGRATPNLDWDVKVSPANGAPIVSQWVHSDASGFLRADFGTDGPVRFDIHGWDRVTIERIDAQGNWFRNIVHQARLLAYPNSRSVLVWGKPDGYVTFALFAPDGTLRGTRKGSDEGDAGSVTLDLPARPGDKLVLEDNGGVAVTSMVIPDVTAAMTPVTHRLTGRVVPAPGMTLSDYVVYGSHQHVGLDSPTASNTVAVRADGTIDTTMPASAVIAWGGYGSSSGSVDSYVLVATPDDHAVLANVSLPGLKLNLDSGAVQVDMYSPCPSLRVSDGRPDLVSHSGPSGYCVATLAPVPASGTTLSVLASVDGRLLASEVVPRMDLAVDQHAGSITETWDPLLANGPMGDHSRSSIVDPTGSFFDYLWPSGSCQLAAGTCTDVTARGVRDGDVVRATVNSTAEPFGAFTRSRTLQPPMRMFYDAGDGTLETADVAPGDWSVRLRAPDGSERARRDVHATANDVLLATFAATDDRPLAHNGDTFEVWGGGSLVHTLPVQLPTAHVDQHTGDLSGTAPATGGTILVGSSPFFGDQATVAADGSFSYRYPLDRGDVKFVSVITSTADRITVPAGRWAFLGRAYDDLESQLRVYNPGRGATQVTVLRDGMVVGHVVLPYRSVYSLSKAELASPLRAGDVVRISGTDGVIDFELPLWTAMVDIGDDRVVGRTDIGIPLDVQAANGRTWATRSLTAAAPSGRFDAQFGIHSSQPVDIGNVNQVFVTLELDGNVLLAHPSQPLVTTDLSTGQIRFSNLPPGSYDLHLVCGTQVDSIAFDTADGNAQLHASQFPRLQVQPGCAFVVDDESGESAFTTEVPTLLGSQRSPSDTTIDVVTEPMALISLTFDGRASRQATSDGAGILSVAAPFVPSATWLSLRDRHADIWHRFVGSTADQQVTEIGANGASVVDPSGLSVQVPPGMFTSNYLVVDPNDVPMDIVANDDVISHGFAAGSSFLSVTIDDAGELGTALDVHDLDVPIRVIVPVPKANTLPDDQLAPAWFSGGRWKLSPHITPGVLPRELSDGYWIEHRTDGARLVVFLTRHLTEFGVLRDARPPSWSTARSALVAKRVTGGISLRWRAPVDTGGIARFRVLLDGRAIRRLAPGVHRYEVRNLKRWPRRVCVEAVDRSGNLSARCVSAPRPARKRPSGS